MKTTTTETITLPTEQWEFLQGLMKRVAPASDKKGLEAAAAEIKDLTRGDGVSIGWDTATESYGVWIPGRNNNPVKSGYANTTDACRASEIVVAEHVITAFCDAAELVPAGLILQACRIFRELLIAVNDNVHHTPDRRLEAAMSRASEVLDALDP